MKTFFVKVQLIRNVHLRDDFIISCLKNLNFNLYERFVNEPKSRFQSDILQRMEISIFTRDSWKN